MLCYWLCVYRESVGAAVMREPAPIQPGGFARGPLTSCMLQLTSSGPFASRVAGCTVHPQVIEPQTQSYVSCRATSSCSQVRCARLSSAAPQVFSPTNHKQRCAGDPPRPRPVWVCPGTGRVAGDPPRPRPVWVCPVMPLDNDFKSVPVICP